MNSFDRAALAAGSSSKGSFACPAYEVPIREKDEFKCDFSLCLSLALSLPLFHSAISVTPLSYLSLTPSLSASPPLTPLFLYLPLPPPLSPSLICYYKELST